MSVAVAAETQRAVAAATQRAVAAVKLLEVVVVVLAADLQLAVEDWLSEAAVGCL